MRMTMEIMRIGAIDTLVSVVVDTKLGDPVLADMPTILREWCWWL